MAYIDFLHSNIFSSVERTGEFVGYIEHQLINSESGLNILVYINPPHYYCTNKSIVITVWANNYSTARKAKQSTHSLFVFRVARVEIIFYFCQPQYYRCILYHFL